MSIFFLNTFPYEIAIDSVESGRKEATRPSAQMPVASSGKKTSGATSSASRLVR